MIDRRFWKRLAAEQRLYHINLKQVTCPQLMYHL
jgi:hypothetical protein